MAKNYIYCFYLLSQMMFVTLFSLTSAYASGTLTVGATLQSSCSVTTTNLTFADYDVTLGSNAPAVAGTGSIQVSCSANEPFILMLDQGQNYASTTYRMKNAIKGSYLNYRFCSDVNCTADLANTGISGQGNSTKTLYGQIPGGQAALIGAYSDTIQVTLAF